jgi:hypothetical protein
MLSAAHIRNGRHHPNSRHWLAASPTSSEFRRTRFYRTEFLRVQKPRRIRYGSASVSFVE